MKAKTKAQRLVIFDGNAIIHRSFHALPPLQTKEGVLVNAVYGFLTTLLKAVKDLRPTHLVATFDLPGPTFRHERYEQYKATRVKQPDELYAQLPIVKDVLRAAGVAIFEAPGFEADDVIGTIATIVEKTAGETAETIIVTGDLDTLQLIDAHTKILTMRKGLSDTVVYDAAAVEERFGLGPKQMIDYKALRGDTSDNIGGVKGIGEKTATELLKKFGTLEKMYSALEAAAGKNSVAAGVTARVQKMLLEQKDVALESKELVTIVRDVPLKFDLGACEFNGIDRGAVFPIFQKLGFLSLLSRLGGETSSADAGRADVPAARPSGQLAARAGTSGRPHSAKHFAHSVIAKNTSETRSIVDKLLQESSVAIYISHNQQQDLFGSAPVIVGLATAKGAAAIIISEEAQWDEIGRLMVAKKVAKTGHDLKQLIHEFAGHGIALGGEFFDVMVAAYLLQAGTRAHDLPSLTISVLGEDVPVAEWSGADGAAVARCAARVWQMAEKLRTELEEKSLTKLFDNIEMPLITPMARMERWGIVVDKKYLAKLDKELSERLEKITKNVWKMAGHEFNVASPQQVADVLFNDLKISSAGLKRGKTGVSTAVGSLEKLQGKHKIVDEILEYREIAKLLNTYIQALPKLLDADSRVHTSFNQAVTATGRLSSSNPNLQNIPVRTDLGRDIRRAFVAADGFELLSCDYSQFELRIVAHLAQDERMIEIFKSGLDVHKATAAEIHGVPLDEVTKEMRFSAKEVNFGVMYGMGAYGLADRTGLTNAEARLFIEKYFATFPQLAAYLEEVKNSARKLGYVETMFGRRRYIPEIKSGVGPVRSAAERMAMNMPIQGTQADILKKAMIAVDEFLCREHGCGLGITAEERAAPVRMLLQVHDELIFEVKDGLAKKLAPQIVEIMSSVVKLAVPVVVDYAVGKNWGELD